jgi:hypothetical protein
MLLLLTVLVVGVPRSAEADESLWVYARGSDTLPAGAWEGKIATITRLDKDSGDYRFVDVRPEIEFGVTDRLTLSLEVLLFDHDYSVEDPDLEPMFSTQGGEGATFDDTQYAGFEVAGKYNVWSPYKDPLGIAVALGYERRVRYRLDGASIDQDSFTVTGYFQKNWLDDTLVLAVTPKIEFERRKSPGVLEEEIAFDAAVGIAYRFVPNWYAGLEFRHQSDYLNPQEDGVFNPELRRSSFDLGDFRIGSQHQRGNYLGPVVHYGGQRWWGTAGLLWQVAGGGSPFSYSRNGRNFDEHEKVHVGIALGVEI